MANQLVTIVTTTHNRPRQIRSAIDSVINQTYPHWELIVTDDGEDRAEATVRSYKDERITYIHKGPSDYYTINRNRGIKRGGGDLFCFLDDDNWWEPNFIEEHVKVHQAKDVIITYSGHWLHKDGMEEPEALPFVAYRGATEEFNGIVDVGDLMIRGKHYFTEELDNPGYCSDLKLVDTLLKKYPEHKIVMIPKRLHHYYWHSGSMTSKKLLARKKGERYLEEAWKF